MRPVDHHPGLPGLPNSQPLPCGDDPALRTSRGESHPAREARSVRHGEGKTPRGLRVITRRDGLSGAQTKSHAGYVPPTHRPRSPEQMGVPCAHGRDPAGDETDSALGTQGLAISAFPITCAGTNVRPDSFRDPDAEGPVRLLHALAAVFLELEHRTNRVDVLRHDIRLLVDRLEVVQALAVDDVHAVPPHGDLVQVGTAPREVAGHLHDLGGRLDAVYAGDQRDPRDPLPDLEYLRRV